MAYCTFKGQWYHFKTHTYNNVLFSSNEEYVRVTCALTSIIPPSLTMCKCFDIRQVKHNYDN